MKSKLLRYVLYLLALIVVVIAGLLIYVKTALPAVGPPPDLKVEITPERLERGNYLANHVAVCMDCHSKRDWSIYSAPLEEGTLGMGGEVFDQKMSFPGSYVASNITPYNLGDWSDGEIFRAITSGVGKDGRALFPIMPHPNFGKMDKEDIYSIIAYVRSLEPIENDTDPSSSDFPMNFIINTIPAKPTFSKKPSPDKLLDYGQYLVNAGSCFDCHTKQDKGQFVGDPFAGGMEFPLPNGQINISANITPHRDGIGEWSADQFVLRFKSFLDTTVNYKLSSPDAQQSIMPWMMYAGMTEQDLTAIYTYLQTLDPYPTKG